MTPTLTESNIENIVLGWFGEFGYAHLYGPNFKMPSRCHLSKASS